MAPAHDRPMRGRGGEACFGGGSCGARALRPRRCLRAASVGAAPRRGPPPASVRVLRACHARAVPAAPGVLRRAADVQAEARGGRAASPGSLFAADRLQAEQSSAP